MPNAGVNLDLKIRMIGAVGLSLLLLLLLLLLTTVFILP